MFSSILKPKAFEFVAAKNLKFEPLNNGILPLQISIILKNPNNLSVFLEAISIDLLAWNSKIGDCQQSPEQEIFANDNFEIALRINLIAAELKSKLKDDFLNILTEGKVKIPLRINGKASIKKFGFGIDIPLEIAKELDLEINSLLSKIKF